MDVVVLGGANVDVKSRPKATLRLGTSNPGVTAITAGGVGRNIADALARLDCRVGLVSVVGDDALGVFVLERTAALGVDVSGVRVLAGAATGVYTAVLDGAGGLHVAVAALDVLRALDIHDVERAVLSAAGRAPATAEATAGPLDGPPPPAGNAEVGTAGVLVIDANVGAALIAHAISAAEACGVAVVIDPVSVPKAERLSTVLGGGSVALLTPNLDELAALEPSVAGDLTAACARLHARGVTTVWVRAGERGSWLARAGHDPVHVPTDPVHGVADVTGAGDTATAAYIWAVQHGHDPIDAARIGTAAAIATLRSAGSVGEDLAAAVHTAADGAPRGSSPTEEP